MKSELIQALREQANKEYPYIHGRGDVVIRNRTRRFKELMREQGLEVDDEYTTYYKG